eukprot:scaffold16384_cov76-Cyclotella_meneghiniana.AAC.3
MGCSTPESKFGFSYSTPYLRCGGSGGGNVTESEFWKQRTGCSAPEFLSSSETVLEVTDRPDQEGHLEGHFMVGRCKCNRPT